MPASGTDPAFGDVDRVIDGVPPSGDDSSLPAELRGKTPAQIAKYYQDREQGYQAEITELRRAPAVVAQPVITPKAKVTAQEFWNDPVASAERIGEDKYVSKGEFNATLANAADTLIQSAKNVVRSENLEMWDRYVNEVEGIMNKLPPESRSNASMWRTALTQVVGVHARELMAEATARAKAPAGEPVSAGITSPELPKELTKEQAYVAEHLGLSKDQYLKGSERIATNSWPLTMSNTNR